MVASSCLLNLQVSLCFSSMICLLKSLVPSFHFFLIANALVWVLYSFTKFPLFGSAGAAGSLGKNASRPFQDTSSLSISFALGLGLGFLGSAFKSFSHCIVGISVVIQSSPSNLASTKPWSPALHSARSKSPAASPLLTKSVQHWVKTKAFALNWQCWARCRRRR